MRDGERMEIEMERIVRRDNRWREREKLDIYNNKQQQQTTTNNNKQQQQQQQQQQQ